MSTPDRPTQRNSNTRAHAQQQVTRAVTRGSTTAAAPDTTPPPRQRLTRGASPVTPAREDSSGSDEHSSPDITLATSILRSEAASTTVQRGRSPAPSTSPQQHHSPTPRYTSSSSPDVTRTTYRRSGQSSPDEDLPLVGVQV